MKTLIDWKVFFILLIVSILATTALLPYVLELQSGIIAQLDIPFPLPVLIALQMIQAGIIFAILIFIGMILMKRIGLSTPILDSVTKGESASDTLRSTLPVSVTLGIIASVLIIGLDFYLFQRLWCINREADTICPSNSPG